MGAVPSCLLACHLLFVSTAVVLVLPSTVGVLTPLLTAWCECDDEWAALIRNRLMNIGPIGLPHSLVH